MITRKYDHKNIEIAAQEKWRVNNIFQTDLSDTTLDPYYLLVEFPYPSGDLHTGHWYAFAVTDIYARILRMRGKNILFPIGFDAFGLPAENAAIKHGIDPKKWTYDNMAHMRTQLKCMGTSFDWSKEVVTCDPNYYKWTQWLFTKLYEHNLAYRAKAPVKWCPKDKTVLANEQVINGHCERCGTEVEERRLTQWFLRITDYAERLFHGLKDLPWREDIKEAQRAWIGKSEGAYINFQVETDIPSQNLQSQTLESIKVFTTRPDTIFGATYVVLAPDNFMVENFSKYITNLNAVKLYVSATVKKTERERSENKKKTGVILEGIFTINPATKEKIPVYVADYVLASYGTGAVMAVPAHDERDFEFAKIYNLSVRTVIKNTDNTQHVITDAGVLINSGSFSGRNSEEAKWDIVAAVGGKRTTQYRIRDWLISRQRYWGCPIPIVYDPQGKPHTVQAEHLPWKLPDDVDFNPTGKSPLATSSELKERVERIFGKGWTPEYDTFDTFVDSSWYFLRYLDSKNENSFSNTTVMKNWTPVDRYSGGSEHTTMHLLYARFFNMALYDLALVPTPEPFNERFNRGLIMGPDGQKMSKSKGNVINPDKFVEKYGADAVRIYLAFIGPYNETGSYPWNPDGVKSMRRFLERVYALSENVKDDLPSEDIMNMLAETAAKISIDSDRFKFNTAVSALMIALRVLEGLKTVSKDAYCIFLKLLTPFAPHLAEHIWEQLGQESIIQTTSWPEMKTKRDSNTIVIVQVNGKRRGELALATDTSEVDAIKAARKIKAVNIALADNTPKRIVYIQGRIINLVF